MLTMSTMILTSGAVAAFASMSGFWDMAHTSEEELTAAIQEQTVAIVNKSQTEARCETLDLQITIVEGHIWQMEQAGNSSQRLVEKRRELRKLEDKRRAMGCAKFD